jgi:hypothetical protein
VDRRRRLGLPELHTSPRLKRRGASWQQVAWRRSARGAQEALVRGWRMAGQCVCRRFGATEERAVGETPRKRCEDFFLDQLYSLPV